VVDVHKPDAGGSPAIFSEPLVRSLSLASARDATDRGRRLDTDRVNGQLGTDPNLR